MASAVPNNGRSSTSGGTNGSGPDVISLQSNIAGQQPDVIGQQTDVEQSANALPPTLEEEEELLVSEHLLQAMTCPVCLRVNSFFFFFKFIFSKRVAAEFIHFLHF